MRFLADENMSIHVVAALRGLGFDVAWIREDSPGLQDPDVLARAIRESRILLTFDKDFGDLAFHARMPADCGVVLFRMPVPRDPQSGARIAAVIATRADWAGCFAVVEAGRLRMRDLPS